MKLKLNSSKQANIFKRVTQSNQLGRGRARETYEAARGFAKVLTAPKLGVLDRSLRPWTASSILNGYQAKTFKSEHVCAAVKSADGAPRTGAQPPPGMPKGNRTPGQSANRGPLGVGGLEAWIGGQAPTMIEKHTFLFAFILPHLHENHFHRAIILP
ncbi:hypothetical protein B0H14DRAFT_2560437 [Mycena olivaceomarginata]|nr:hypothetical protein B0H14DRAFT_2560437 [Mycena olivaceomarginata]